MKNTLLMLTSVASLACVVSAQTVTTNSSGFNTILDSFEGDVTGTLTSGYTTVAGNTISYATNSTARQQESIFQEYTSGATGVTGFFSTPSVDGIQAWTFHVSGNGADTSHSARFSFASPVSAFGLNVLDFGDGGDDTLGAFSALKITASDGTVMFDYDEAIDGSYSPLDSSFFVGIQGGSFTGFSLEHSTLGDSNGSGGFDNFAIDKIVTVPEPSSTALLGLGALGLLVRRKR